MVVVVVVRMEEEKVGRGSQTVEGPRPRWGETKRKVSGRERGVKETASKRTARRLLPLSASIEGTRRDEREDRPGPEQLNPILRPFFVFEFSFSFFFRIFLHAPRNRKGRKGSNRFGRMFDFGLEMNYARDSNRRSSGYTLRPEAFRSYEWFSRSGYTFAMMLL